MTTTSRRAAGLVPEGGFLAPAVAPSPVASATVVRAAARARKPAVR